MSGTPLPPETVAEFEAAIASWPEPEHLTWRTIFGEMFVLIGNREAGLELLRLAAADDSVSPYDVRRALAATWLRGHGESSRPEEGGRGGPDALDEPDA